MRLRNFESGKYEPIGEGGEKKVFVDPENKDRAIAELKGDESRETLGQLKGRYYLTKIVHHLLPENIPDIFQAGESKEGVQATDLERISHSELSAKLEKSKSSKQPKKELEDKFLEEHGEKIKILETKLHDLGLGFIVDPELSNYVVSDTGQLHYVESLKPWNVYSGDDPEVDVLYEREILQNAIEQIQDEGVKKRCVDYLNRLDRLIEDEREYLNNLPKEAKLEAQDTIQNIDEAMEKFSEKHDLEYLTQLTDAKVSANDPRRLAARDDLRKIFDKIEFLEDRTNVLEEDIKRIRSIYNDFMNAVGVINHSDILHNRY